MDDKLDDWCKEIFWSRKKFGVQKKKLAKKLFCPKTYGLKNTWVKTILGKNILGQNNVVFKEIWDPNKIWNQKILGLK